GGRRSRDRSGFAAVHESVHGAERQNAMSRSHVRNGVRTGLVMLTASFSHFDPIQTRTDRLLVHVFAGQLVLVHDVELDYERRFVGEVLIAVNGAARKVDVVTGFEGARLLALDGQSNLSLLDGIPLIAKMPVETAVTPQRESDGS